MYELFVSDVKDNVILLKDNKNQQYNLFIDDKLISIVQQHRYHVKSCYNHISHNEIDNSINPRDIQLKIRSGMSVDEIAKIHNIPKDWIQKFEPPIIAERRFIVGKAQKNIIIKNDKTRITLKESVNMQCTKNSINVNHGIWDAVKIDSIWKIFFTFLINQKEYYALWFYNTIHKTLDPQNDEAKFFMQLDGHKNLSEIIPSIQFKSTKEEKKKNHKINKINTKIPKQDNPIDVIISKEVDSKAKKDGVKDGHRAVVPKWDDIYLNMI